MNTRTKFSSLPTERPPVNRRVYEAATKPFGYLWEFVSWAGKPWLQALPVAMVAALVVCLTASGKPGAATTVAGVAFDTVTVGLVWTFYLGIVLIILKGIRALLR